MAGIRSRLQLRAWAAMSSSSSGRFASTPSTSSVTIGAHARNWSLERMPAIDRNLLRLALYELKDRPDVPVAVVIDEAVELAKRLSTDDSGRFVNGMLSAIAPKLRPPPEDGEAGRADA